MSINHLQLAQQILGQESTPNPAPELDRPAKEREAIRWCYEQARQAGVQSKDPAWRFMEEVMIERRDEVWATAGEHEEVSDEDFRRRLRRWAATARKALETGIEAEDETMKKNDQIITERQAFAVARECGRSRC